MSYQNLPSQKRRRVKLDLRKTMFVLPNLFTLSSIFCGFYAIVLCGSAPTAVQINTAAMLIAFALFFDLADGRVARLTKTQSDFGIQLDSLADIVAFGVAPALLSYRYGLHALGGGGIFVAFSFAACGAIRLARFNVMAQREDGPCKFFTGLPIPLAAGMVISVMLANQGNPLTARGAGSLAVLMLAMSYLMVSNVRYRTFKKVESRSRLALVLACVILTFAFAAQAFHPGMALAMLFSAYVTLGLVEEIVFFRARRHDESRVPAVDAEELAPLFFEAEDDESEDERLA